MNRSHRNRACLVVCLALLSGCGSSAAQTRPSSSGATQTAPSGGATTGSTGSTGSTGGSTGGSGGGATGGPSAGSSICGPSHARTLAVDARARVYAAGGQVVGCVHSGGSYVLGRSTSCLGGTLAGPVALSGVRVAVAVKRCGVDTGRSEVLVRRLDTGQVLRTQPATSTPLGAESYVTVSAIVLARNGAMAWISEAASIVSQRRLTQVHASGPGGTRLLDSGAAIGPRSLRLAGTVLRWREGGRVRSARLG